MESVNEPSERYVGESYAEFLYSMQALSGLSQRELAEFIGLSHGSISNYMRGERVSNGGRRAIAKAFELSEEESTRLGGGVPLGFKSSPELLQEKREQANFREQLSKALIERVASGPPLGEREEKLLRELGGLSIDEHQEHS